jgi:hypothetical protein
MGIGIEEAEQADGLSSPNDALAVPIKDPMDLDDLFDEGYGRAKLLLKVVSTQKYKRALLVV